MNTKIKCLSLLLALVLVLGMLPAAAMAEGTEPVTVKATYTQEGTSTYLPGTCEVQYTINDTAESDITIDVMDAVMKALPEGESMPTHQLKVKVSITNNSPNAFVYKNNGMQLGTNSYDEEEPIEGFVGYDGNELPIRRISGISYAHPAMTKLFGKYLGNMSDEDYQLLLKMDEYLKKSNYATLSDCFLDYYQEYYKDDTLSWDTLCSTYRNQLIQDFQMAKNGLWSATDKKLNQLAGTLLDNYTMVYVNQQLKPVYIQFKWPDAKLAALSYDIFYQDLLSVVFDDVKVDIHQGDRSHGVGDYLDKTAEPYTSANQYLVDSMGDDGQIASGETASFMLTITLEGKGTGNMYTYYVYDGLFNLTLQFVRAPQASTTTPPQTGDNANVQLWLALACLSLSCMAVAFGKARIQSRRKG